MATESMDGSCYWLSKVAGDKEFVISRLSLMSFLKKKSNAEILIQKSYHLILPIC